MTVSAAENQNKDSESDVSYFVHYSASSMRRVASMYQNKDPGDVLIAQTPMLKVVTLRWDCYFQKGWYTGYEIQRWGCVVVE